MLTLEETRGSAIRAKAIVFEDPRSREILEQIRRIAPSDAPVLITGETGTGKELVARHIHGLSGRAREPFLAVNAGAFSETLIESELFGHEKGAFTGAHTANPGWFEAAHRGTLFLDEIGDLPVRSQVKLLRVLQEGEVVRLGSRVARPVDVRLIAATNVDLPLAIRARTFREDLYYRLKVTSITLPPLRDRPGDILPLARHFLAVYRRRLGKGDIGIGADAAEKLLEYPWPGNIRELENAIHHAVLVCQGDALSAGDLQLAPHPPASSRAGWEAGSALPFESSSRPSEAATAPDELATLERVFHDMLAAKVPDLHARVEATLLRTAYRFAGRNQLEVARLLGISRNVVRARLIACGVLPGPLRRRSSTRNPVTTAPKLQTAIVPRYPMRIGCQKLGLLMLVKGYGALDAVLAARGASVRWIEYDGGLQIVEALRAGALDVGVLGDCPAIVAQAQGVPIVYLAAEPPAPRGAAVIVPASSPLRSVSELRGRRVAVHRAAQAHYLLLKALEEAGIGPADVEICYEPPERALRAFRAGTIDAWAIWDPWLSSARLELGGIILRDATGLMRNSAYYVARREFVGERPDLVEELVTQLRVAAIWAQRDPLRAASVVAPALGLSPRAIAASLERDLRAAPISDEQIAAQQDIADNLLRLRLIPRPVSIAEAQWRFEFAG